MKGKPKSQGLAKPGRPKSKEHRPSDRRQEAPFNRSGGDPRPRDAVPRAPVAAEHEFWIKSESALDDYLKYSPKAVREVWLKGPSAKEKAGKLAEIIEVPIRVGEDESLWPVSDTPLAFKVELRTRQEEELWLRLDTHPPRCILALDHIQDPRNLGAIVRSAAFFGIREIIVPSRRQVLITDASVQTSQGGFALVQLYVIPNLVRSLEALKQKGFWVIGADAEGRPLDARSFDFDRVVLVLGAEHKGLAPLVARTADALVAIQRSSSGFDSLNVSVACGILLHELVRPRA